MVWFAVGFGEGVTDDRDLGDERDGDLFEAIFAPESCFFFLSERIYGGMEEVWIVPASSTSKDLPRTWTSELHNSGSGSSDSEKDSRRSVNACIMKLM